MLRGAQCIVFSSPRTPHVMRHVCLFVFALLLVGAGLHRDAAAQHATEGPIYSVAVYDTLRNPAEDLEATIQQARAEGKRILIEVGGEWCSWCHRLDEFFHENRAVAQALRDGFIIMKVNYSIENRNEAFLSNFPRVRAFPHLLVLDSDGTFLHAQRTGPLEENGTYSEERFLTFLSEWAPPN